MAPRTRGMNPKFKLAEQLAKARATALSTMPQYGGPLALPPAGGSSAPYGPFLQNLLDPVAGPATPRTYGATPLGNLNPITSTRTFPMPNAPGAAGLNPALLDELLVSGASSSPNSAFSGAAAKDLTSARLGGVRAAPPLDLSSLMSEGAGVGTGPAPSSAINFANPANAPVAANAKYGPPVPNALRSILDDEAAGIVRGNPETKLGAFRNKALDAGGLSRFFGKAAPLSLSRGLMGGGAGLLTGMVADPILDQFIGGEAADPGFSWGGLAKSALGGAAAGGVTGAVAGGGVGALPGAVLGALLGAGGYAFSDLTDKTAEIPTIDENIDQLQTLATSTGTDPALTAQILGSYKAMAQFYKDNGKENQLPDLTESTFQSLSQVLGTPAPKPLLDPRQLEQVSQMMFEQTSPYLDQMSADSPYRVALLQQLSNFPTSLALSGALTPAARSASAMDATRASGQGAAMAAGLDADTMKKLVANGVKM